jgi:hypothetical protein
MEIFRKYRRKRLLKIQIFKTDLPSVNAIKQINLLILKQSKITEKDKGLKSSRGEYMIYNLWGISYGQMKKYILNLPQEKITYLENIKLNFPEKSSIFDQCAYYFRAFSRCQIFKDGNHRTGFFALQNILRKKDIKIDTSL